MRRNVNQREIHVRMGVIFLFKKRDAKFIQMKFSAFATQKNTLEDDANLNVNPDAFMDNALI